MKNRKIDDATRQAAWEELARLRIRGATAKKCAELLGFSLFMIEKWLRNKEFRLQMMRTRALVFQRTEDVKEGAAKEAVEGIREIIEQFAQNAIYKMNDMMETAKSESIQLRAAIELADRSKETQKTRKIETDSRVLVFTPENLALAAAKAREIREDHLLGKVVKPLELDTDLIELVDNEG